MDGLRGMGIYFSRILRDASLSMQIRSNLFMSSIKRHLPLAPTVDSLHSSWRITNRTVRQTIPAVLQRSKLKTFTNLLLKSPTTPTHRIAVFLSGQTCCSVQERLSQAAMWR